MSSSCHSLLPVGKVNSINSQNSQIYLSHHNDVEVIVIWQQVETDRRLFHVQEFNLLASLFEPFDVSQLPILNKIKACNHNKTLWKFDSFKTSTVGTKWITCRMVSVFTFRKKSSPIPIPVS
ncbi:hypothetical protein ERO13_D11G270801v2 [Gossypium hirsutum]|nr:hypothetical protein ES319_D11G295300v1 [Gossypium barbadense]KAG4122500.1 hypothetical protein ERO13_D11G270801v2 [Gossypium hirsutum]KJB45126.1 hypothetical protein B456_007G291300 [Gossypium raimondii]TYH46136.1 hypothetical protein ES332_D11G315100v1 [Gossypium tomentosum]